MNPALQLMTVAMMVTQTGGDAKPTQNQLKLPRAIVSVIRQVQVPARQAGVIKSLSYEDGSSVKEGHAVNVGQLLGTLDDEDPRARRRAAQTEHLVAKAETEKARAGIQAAKATVLVAEAEVKESTDINKRAAGSVPETQVRRQVLTVERAKSEAIVADRELETATLTIDAKDAQLEVATITLKQHQIMAPQDGVIVQIYRRVGDWVSPGDPILKLVFMDEVRVEGFVNADDYTPDEILGREVEITVHMPRGKTEKFRSVITYVSPIIESSGDFRVFCDVENRQAGGYWILRPGGYAEISIDLTSPPAKVAVK